MGYPRISHYRNLILAYPKTTFLSRLIPRYPAIGHRSGYPWICLDLAECSFFQMSLSDTVLAQWVLSGLYIYIYIYIYIYSSAAHWAHKANNCWILKIGVAWPTVVQLELEPSDNAGSLSLLCYTQPCTFYITYSIPPSTHAKYLNMLHNFPKCYKQSCTWFYTAFMIKRPLITIDLLFATVWEQHPSPHHKALRALLCRLKKAVR